tara:strand:+ start:42 stop:596 length:555 start_codon:yes stop_codon:yes gene_type:complete
MKGYIYKLYCLNDDIKECYIGSCWDIKVRMRVHKYDCTNINSANHNYKVYSFIRANGNWENFDYEYYQVEVIDRTDLKMKEQDRMDIEVNILLNGKRAYTDRTEYDKQYIIDNKESIKLYTKQYKIDNKESIKQYNVVYYIDNKETINLKKNKKYNCECGGKYTHQHKAQHFKRKKHQTYINQV